MSMMRIGEVRMRVSQRCVAMPMRVRRSGGHGRLVRVLMVRIVCMWVFVFKRFVNMEVVVAFGDMQANSQHHQ